MENLSTADDAVTFRWKALRVVWAIAAMVLFAATWKLWTPQTVFPQVPFLNGLQIHDWVAWILFGAIFVLLIGTIFDRIWSVSMLAFLFILTLLILEDQHRLQPWAYQFGLVAVAFVLMKRPVFLQFARLLAISIYIYSALGKFDFQFTHSVGQEFLSEVCRALQVDLFQLSLESRWFLAGLFPLGEFAIGGFLLVAVFQTKGWQLKLATVLTGLFHFGLLLILGPWGLNHQPAVLIWNLFFIAQTFILFWPSIVASQNDSTDSKRTHSKTFQWRSSLGYIFAVLAIGFPAGESLGFVDHWPAWGLYSPRNSRATLELPPWTTPSVVETYCVEGKCNLDRWSLESLGVPNYPQARFQVGVCKSLLAKDKRFELTARVSVERMSDRWTGKREIVLIKGMTELERASRLFYLNCEPSGRFKP